MSFFSTAVTNNNASAESRKLDWMTLSIYIALVGIGWMMIYAVGYRDGYTEDWSVFFKLPVGKQTIAIALASVVLIVILVLDWKVWRTFAYLFYAIGLLLLLLVPFLGVEINGSKSWFSMGGFSIQPAELAKFGTCLALSSYLSTYGTNLRELRSQILAVSFFAAPMLLIMLQPDAGSALVFLSFLILLYREGFSPTPYLVGMAFFTLFIFSLIYESSSVVLSLLVISLAVVVANVKLYRIYWAAAVVAVVVGIYFASEWGYKNYALLGVLLLNVVAGIFLWNIGKSRVTLFLTFALTVGAAFSYSANYAFYHILKPHQQDRINVWMQPKKCDPRGSLYNVLQSKMAIGSGGWEGKGFLQGTMTKLNFVPEQRTDFIFCTIGEEQGFIGSLGIIGLFLLLLIRVTIIAERQRSDFSRHYAYGVAGILFVHFFINIGMTMGLLPVIGIPLPLISYGGSSLIGFTVLIGVLLRLDSYRYSG